MTDVVRGSGPRRRSVVVLLAACALPGAFARGEDAEPPVGAADVEIGNGDVFVTKLAERESSTVRLRAPVGAKVKVQAATGKGAALRVSSRAPSGPSLGSLDVRAGKSKSLVFVAAEDGLARFDAARVPPTPGRVAVRTKWTSPKSFALTPAPGTRTATLRVDADAGAVVRLRAADAETGAAAAIDRIDGPGGVSVELEPGTALRFRAPCTGRYDVTATSPEADGTLELSARVKSPRRKPVAVDPDRIVSDGSKGAPGVGGVEGRRLVQRRIGCEGGAIEALPLADGEPILEDLEGTRLAIPAGTFDDVTIVSVATSPVAVPFVGLSPTSAPFVFDAQGRPLGRPVDAEVPFGRNPVDATDPRVATLPDDGAVEEIPGAVEVPGAGTVKFPASHFSLFQVFGQASRIRRLGELSVVDATILLTSTELGLSVLFAGPQGIVAVRSEDFLLYAGNGTRTGDGVHRLEYDFTADGDSIQSVHRGYSPDQEVVVATGTRIFRIDDQGLVWRIAGTGANETSGDGGPATAAGTGGLIRVAVSLAGDVYFAVPDGHRVRRIRKSDGVIDTVLGDGTAGTTPDGSAAAASRLDFPRSVAADGSGRVVVGDERCVYRADLAAGTVRVVAGDASPEPGAFGDRSPLRQIRFGALLDVDVSLFNDENVIAADASADAIWSLDLLGGRGHVVVGRINQFAGRPPDEQDAPGSIGVPVWVVPGERDLVFGALEATTTMGLYYLEPK